MPYKDPIRGFDLPHTRGSSGRGRPHVSRVADNPVFLDTFATQNLPKCLASRRCIIVSWKLSGEPECLTATNSI